MRPTLDEYFLKIAEATATRGTCDRALVGAVIVKDGKQIAAGYNGSPSGTPHCDEIGHELDGDHCTRTVHAEANAIAMAAQLGISLKGSTLYCTMCPCYSCAKLLINCGIYNVIATNDYHSSSKTKLLFQKLGLTKGTRLKILNAEL